MNLSANELHDRTDGAKIRLEMMEDAIIERDSRERENPDEFLVCVSIREHIINAADMGKYNVSIYVGRPRTNVHNLGMYSINNKLYTQIKNIYERVKEILLEKGISIKHVGNRTNYGENCYRDGSFYYIQWE